MHELQRADDVVVTPITSIQGTPRRDEVYDFLESRGVADLCVDVGAGMGHVSRRLVHQTRELLAYEPFPNNVKLFRQRLGGHGNIRLIEKAISNKKGRTTLFVHSTVQGDEPGWADSVGFSSVGRIETSKRNMFRSYRHLAWDVLRHRRGATTVRVRTTTLDAELAGRTVDFLKVDVQGAETQVLEGARSLLEAQRIRLIYLEWTGNPEVIERLTAAGYAVYDSVYLGYNPDAPEATRREFESNDFEVIGTTPLSSGGDALEMVYHGNGDEIGSKLRRLNRGYQFLQTDLIALPNGDAPAFVDFVRTR